MSGSMAGGSQALRSPWHAFVWALGAFIAMTGAVVVAQPLSPGSLSFVITVALGMLIPGLWVALRVPFMRVTCDAEGLVYHGLFRNRHFRWEEIERIEVGEFGNAIGSSFAPELVRTDGAEPVMLTHLASYGTKRVARQIAEIERWRAGGVRAVD